MRAKLVLWSAAATLALVSTAAIANVVVVKSIGPSAKSYPPGKTLPESAKITLKGGDVITILGPGTAKTLRGPGNFDAKQVTLASAAGQRGRFGALRAGEIAHNPSIWDIDVSQGGKICISDASKLQLWRPDSEAEVTATIRSADGQSQPLSWAAGKSLAAWPATVPIQSNASYDIEWPDTGEKSTLEVVTVPATPDDIVTAAQVLIEHGCQKQLDLLVESTGKAH
ncbi:MAG: hypothetical protein ABIO80_01640 [Sphingomicrobium sp.]